MGTTTPPASRWPAIATLLLLAPVVAEVLSGSTPVTGVFGLLFFIPMYGAGALLIREAARRRRAGWGSVLLLGAAFALIEEGLVVQAIFHPQAIEAASWGAAAGGHVLGVYGTFALAVTAYHAVWSITLRILLCDLLFPAHRDSPLLGRTGLLLTSLTFVAGLALVAVLVRTQIAPGYSTPAGQLAVTGLLVVAVIALAVGPASRTTTTDSTPSITPAAPWTVVSLTSSVSFAFLGLLMFPAAIDSPLTRAIPDAVTTGAAVAIAVLALWQLHRWSRTPAWGDLHRLAIAAGLLLVSPLIAVVQASLHTYGNPGDRAGLIAVEILAIGFLVWLTHRLRRRRVTVATVPRGSSGSPRFHGREIRSSGSS